MDADKIVVRLHPTDAAKRLSDEDLEKLARMIKLSADSLKDHIARGKRIKIALPNHPGAVRLLKLIRTFGFEPASSDAAPAAPVVPSAAKEDAKARDVSIPARQSPMDRQADTIPGKPGAVPAAGAKTSPHDKKSAHPHKTEGTEWKPGDVIESLYEVRDIKYGGMGAVYVVRHLRLNTMMALKSLYHRLRESEEELALFLKEAETWIDIGFHPNIAACYYVRNIKGSPRIFIEYADGGSLNEWLAGRTNVGWDQMIDLFVQVGDGLGHAHLKGLVHRDVKPGNCMLTREGVVKVTDFGLTKRRRKEPQSDGLQTFATSGLGNAPTTVTAAGMGTPAYMAPEMWVQGGEVGPAADIYAYGVMAFELCCGRKPFLLAKGEKLGKLALEHLKKPPPTPSRFRPDMPKGLESVILRCLSKNPDERYASFAEIREELAELYQDLFKCRFPREKPDEVQLRSDALNNRAVSLMDLNHGEEAWEVLKKAVEADPHHPEAVYNLWILEWLRTGEQDRDLSVRLEEVVKTPEYRGRGGRLLGRCLLAQGDAEGALRACRASLSAAEADEAGLKPYAMALIAHGSDEDAIDHLESYLERYPGDDDARLWLIGALTRSGKLKAAEKYIGCATSAGDACPMTPQQIADSYLISPSKEKIILQGHTGWITCLAFFPLSGPGLTRAGGPRVYGVGFGVQRLQLAKTHQTASPRRR
jgi:serine/threonine protein kinase